MEWGGWSLADRVINTTPPARLAKAESVIMELLIQAQGHEVTTKRLNEAIGGSRAYLRHVLRDLREIVSVRAILNVRGVGYRLRKKQKNEAYDLVRTLEKALRDARRIEAQLDYE